MFQLTVPDERLVNTSISCHPCKRVILDVQPNQAFRCPSPDEPSDHSWVKDQKREPTNQAQSTHRPCNILVCSQSSHQISEWFVHNNKEGKGGKKAKKKKKAAEMSTKLHIEDILHIYKICITKGRIQWRNVCFEKLSQIQ